MFKLLHRFRLFLIRLLSDKEAYGLYQFLHAQDSAVAHRSFERFFRPGDKHAGYVPESDSRPFLERAYHDAQKHGSERNGWRLRFILYYDLGKMDGLW